jgi:hypothetical protein
MPDNTDTNEEAPVVAPYMGEPINTEEQQEEKEAQEETEEKHTEYSYVPWGVTSFAALADAQDARAAALQVKTLSDQLVEMTSNIMYSSEVEDKSSALSSLAAEYKTLIDAQADDIKEVNWLEQVKDTVTEAITGLFKQEQQEPPASGFMLWKEEDGSLRWFARYSNNFRDNDNPPEIISSSSHRRFVEMVDRKEAPLPELWLWHVPEWKLGEADWLAYDDSGFALASGTIDRGKEMVAEQIAKAKIGGVSHGMPVSSIKRDPDDLTVIVEHETREISPLPPTNAANKLGEWILLGKETDDSKEGNNMPIPDQKKQDLLERWKIDAEVLEQLESLNAEDADKASEEGRESKEAAAEKPEDEATTEEEKEEETKDEEESTEEETPTEPVLTEEEPITREEIADAITTVLKPYMDVVDELRGEVKELQKTDKEKIEKAAVMTPSVSVGAIMAERFSAIGDKSAQVRKNEKLAKEGPEEAQLEQVVPISFLNEMIVNDSKDGE